MGRIYREVKDFNDYTKSMDLALKPFTPLFDITFADTNIKGKSKIIFFFLKPEQSTRDTFGFDREILGIFFRYPEIHTRLFEQIDTILSEFRSRLDQMVCVLISESDKIAEEIKQFPVLDSNRICIIPIPISRLVEKKIDAAELKKIFQDNMYHRDLFAVESPIQNSRAFFGRDEIVITFIDRIKNNQNSLVSYKY